MTFTTDQGTWMSVDVAPDGRTIVFDLLGDIYAVPMSGGDARRLTGGRAFDGEPAYSPDGKQIAFVSDRDGVENIWMMDAGGGDLRPFTQDTVPVVEPQWLSGGEFVLVARRAGAYRLYRSDGSGVALRSRVDRPISSEAGTSAWSRDGRFIYELPSRPGQLWRIDVAQGLREQISEFEYVQGFRPVVSPDGRRVVFGFRRDTETGLRLFDVDAAEGRELLYPLPDRDLSPIMDASRAALPRFAFTPDGQSIVLATGGKLQRLDVHTGRLRPIPFRATVEVTLGANGGPSRTAQLPPAPTPTIRDLQRDPTGRRVVFEALDRIWVREGDRPPRLLVETPASAEPMVMREPALSPDGQSVAYVSWHDSSGGQFWRVSIQGGTPTQLTRRPGVYRHPVWSPDGARLAVVREEETASPFGGRSRTGKMPGEVYIIPAAGGTPRHVRAVGPDERPAFAGDGERIVVAAAERAHDRNGPASVSLPWPVPQSSGSIALEGATLITMRGDEVIRDGTVLVTGGRIAAVGRRGSVELPANTRRVDVSGQTIIPGLIDVRTEIPLVRDVLEGTNLALAANLALGVTTVSARPTGADPTRALELAAHYRERLEAGTMVGARLLPRGQVSAASLRDLDSAGALVQRAKAAGAVTIQPAEPLTRWQQQWLAEAAREAALPLIAPSQDLQQVLTCLADRCAILEGNIPNPQIHDDVRRLLAASGIVYAPTLMDAVPGSPGVAGTAEGYFKEHTDVRDDPMLQRFGFYVPARTSWLRPKDYSFLPASRQAAELARRGVPVVAGTAAKGYPGLGLHWELWALQLGGLSSHEALRTATATAARALGLEGELGLIAPGALADLVVLNANPLEDVKRTRDIRFVMRSGMLFDAATLAQIWPRRTPPLPLRDTRYDPPEAIAQANPGRTRAPRVTIGPAPDVRRMPDSLLIKPARTISFQTDELSGINLDLSPDGKTLVFDYLGDLYTLPVTGGRATQLTRGLGVDERPVWSPDGKRIAFASDAGGVGNLWVMEADGSGARPAAPEEVPEPYDWYVYEVPSVEWSPDGRSLLNWNRLVHLSGGEDRLEWLPPRLRCQAGVQARYSADGRYLYVYRNGMRRYERRTGEGMQLANPPRMWSGGAVSPNGRWLAYVAGYPGLRGGLRVLNLETGEDRMLAFPIRHGGGDRSLVFTRDSRALLSAHNGKLHRIDVATGEDTLIPVTLTTQTDLGPFVYHTQRVANEPRMRVRYIRTPALSTDGQELVFSALRRLYRMRLPSGEPEPLTEPWEAGQFDPAYSPDGRWIAFVTWKDGEGGHLWKIPAAGGKPVRLTTVPTLYSHPAWSPDGTELALIRRGPKNSRRFLGRFSGILLVIPSAGGPARVLVDRVNDAPVTFTQDGLHILYNTFSTDGNTAALASIGRNGGEPRRLAHAPRDGYGVFSIWPSPDGRYVAYQSVMGEIYLAPLPQEGQEPVQLSRGAVPLVQPTCGMPSEPIPVAPPKGAPPVVRLAPGVDPTWDADGKALTWVSGPLIYRVNPDQAMVRGARAAEDSPRSVVLAERQPTSPPRVVSEPVGEIELFVPRSLPDGVVALRGVRAVTLRGDEVFENATIVITNDRISAIGPASQVRIPAGAQVLELQGKTVIPGFIDLHAHGPQRTELFLKENAYLRTNLAYGVTSVRELAGEPTLFDVGARVETGDIHGSRLFHDGHHFNSSGNQFESLEDARAEVQHLKRMGAMVIKEYQGHTRRRTQWVIRAADEAGLNVTAHPALSKVLDGITGQEHWAPLQSPVFFAASRTWWTTTHTSHPHYNPRYQLYDNSKYRRFWARVDDELRYGEQDPTGSMVGQGFAEVTRHGGRATPASHGNTPGIGMHFDVWINQQFGGLTPLEALRAASLRAAEGLGVQRDLGSLEVGKIADLMVLDRNPIENIEHTLTIRYVMKNGELYDGETLATIWPERRPSSR